MVAKRRMVALSYSFLNKVYDPFSGYSDYQLHWYEGLFNPQGWVADGLIESHTQGARN